MKTRSRPEATLFGDLLREHRLRRGFSQEFLAERAGVSAEAVSSLERGTRRAPLSNTLTALVAALELSESESLEFEMAASQARARVHANAPRPQAANNLPAELSSFVGRETDVNAIRQFVNEHRLVSIVGAAGIGKTRVALRVAAHLLDASFQGVWFIDLASLRDPELMAGAILSTLNVPEIPNRLQLDVLIAYLKTKEHVLLLLDNCEHLIHAAATTSEAILQSCPRVTILATSREVLGLQGEFVVRLSTLNVPDAVSLFVARARGVDSRFALTDSLEPTIIDVCGRLDCIALAIELAAARINILSAVELAQSLDERLLNLTSGKRTAPSRHRTLRATLDWSYDLLDAEEQRVLRKLSVFVGGFTLELANEKLELLSSLVDKSLIQYETRYATTRYRLLEPTRQHAMERLCECEELDAAARSHALSMVALVERFSALDFVSDHALKTQAQPEIENWRAAMVWAFGRQGDRLVGQQLAGAVNDIWFTHAAEGWRWVRTAIGTCDETTPVIVRAKLELAQVIMSYPLGRAQTRETLVSTEKALRLYGEAGDRLGTAAAQIFLGEQLIFKGRRAEAERLLRSALTAAEDGKAPRLVAMATRFLGISRARAGDLDEGRRLIGASVAMYRVAGATSSALAIQGLNFAEFEFLAGNAEAALQLALESIKTHKEYNLSFGLCAVLGNAAAYALALECFDEARDYAREAITLAADMGFSLKFAWAAQHLAVLAALRPRDRRRAAQALGFVNARLAEFERQRDFTELQGYDNAVILLHKEFGDELDALMREGAQWSQEHALQQLLDI